MLRKMQHELGATGSWSPAQSGQNPSSTELNPVVVIGQRDQARQDGQDAPRARLTLLLEHFSELSDDREPGRIMYPLAEVLLLVTCATIASCDDFDDIARPEDIAAQSERDKLSVTRTMSPTAVSLTTRGRKMPATR